MARRGRFGTSAAGSSNLSATIQSLLREQKAAEERLLLQAFYDGTEIYGKVPTIDDVISFYNDLASLGGFDENSMEWQALTQKINAANNFDIKRTYNSLISEFNRTGGSNYSQIISFLNGRAKDSTDSSDISDYEGAFESVTSSYITMIGAKLSQNRIGIEEYRSLVQSALNNLTPGTEVYNNALNEAKVSEWNKEKSKMDNLLTAKKISYGDYVKWAREFRQSTLASGIERNSELDTAIQAAIAVNSQRAASAAASAAVAKAEKKSGKAEASILNLYAIAATQSGVPVDTVTMDKLAKGEPFTIEDVIANPEVIASYMRLVDSGAINIDERLVKMGLDSGYLIRSFYDSELNSLVYNAKKVYAATGDKTDLEFYQKSAKLYYRTGTASKLDEVSDAATQYAKDLQEAGKDDFAIMNAMNEWASFLSPVLTGRDGQQTRYGSLTAEDIKSLVPPEFSQDQTILMSYLLNSATVASGQMVPSDDQLTLEGAMNVTIVIDGKEYNIQEFYKGGSIEATNNNVMRLLNGDAAQKIQLVNGVFERPTVDLPATGPQGTIVGSDVAAGTGQLNQISLRKFNGQYYPILQSVAAANEIRIPGANPTTQEPELQVWGYKYLYENGKEIYISADGESFDQNPFESVLAATNDGALVPVGSRNLNPNVKSLPAIPVIDVDVFYESIGGTRNPNALRKLADSLSTTLLNTDNPVIQKLAQVLGTDLEQAVANAQAEIAQKADSVELVDLQRQSFRMTELDVVDSITKTIVDARIAELSSKVYGDKYKNGLLQNSEQFLNFVAPNQDKYTEIEPGVWKLNDDIRQQQTRNTLGQIGLAASALNPFAAIGGLAGQAIAGAITGNVPSALGAASSIGQVNLPDVVNLNPTKPRDWSPEFAKEAKETYLGAGGAGSLASPYFRNLIRPSAPTTVDAKKLPTVPISTVSSQGSFATGRSMSLAKAYSLTAEGKQEAARASLVARPTERVSK
jgi:hypothetical protein